jgi:hypothetical protein
MNREGRNVVTARERRKEEMKEEQHEKSERERKGDEENHTKGNGK